MEKDVELKNEAGYTLRGRLWLPSDRSPVVLTSHGANPITSFGKRYVRLAEALYADGIGCLNFFYLGTDVTQRIDDMKNMSLLLQQNGTDKIGIYGSSYGASIVRIFACYERSPLYRASVTWNAIGPGQIIEIGGRNLNADLKAIVENGVPQIPWLIVDGGTDILKDGRGGGHTEANRLEKLVKAQLPNKWGREISRYTVPNGDHGLEAEEHLVDALGPTVHHFKKYLLV